MKHKLIMENWKSFLNESSDKDITRRLSNIYTAAYGIGLTVQAFGSKIVPSRGVAYKKLRPNFMTNLRAMRASSVEMQQILKNLGKNGVQPQPPGDKLLGGLMSGYSKLRKNEDEIISFLPGGDPMIKKRLEWNGVDDAMLAEVDNFLNSLNNFKNSFYAFMSALNTAAKNQIKNFTEDPGEYFYNPEYTKELKGKL